MLSGMAFYRKHATLLIAGLALLASTAAPADEALTPAKLDAASIEAAKISQTQTFRPLSTDAGRIVDAAGQPVRLHGVNWFGFESRTFAPHGLWRRNWRDMLDQMRDLGFNGIAHAADEHR